MRALFIGSMLVFIPLVGCDSPREQSQPSRGMATPAAADTEEQIEEAREAQKEREDAARKRAEADTEREAKAAFLGAKTTTLGGEAKLTVVPEGVRVVIDLESFPPGTKGAHVHEKDDCSDLANQSMGDPFSPDERARGVSDDDAKTLGELGNVYIDADGEGHIDFVLKGANLKDGDERSLLGRSIVIHEDTAEGSVASAGRPLACAPIQLDT